MGIISPKDHVEALTDVAQLSERCFTECGSEFNVKHHVRPQPREEERGLSQLPLGDTYKLLVGEERGVRCGGGEFRKARQSP